MKWYSLSALLSLLLFYLPIESYIYASVFLLSFWIFSIYIDVLRVVITNVFLNALYICIILSFIVYLLIIYALCADIDGQDGMRLIYGIIVVEEKGRVARVGKVMKYLSIIITYILIEKTYI